VVVLCSMKHVVRSVDFDDNRYYVVLVFRGTGEEHVYGMLRISSRVQDPSLYAYGADVVVMRKCRRCVWQGRYTHYR
jgi:hypothetical protein